MTKVAATAAFVAFWMDRDLLTLQDYKRHIPGNRLQLFRDLATSFSRVLALLNDFLFTAWSNWELKRRDTAFQHLSSRSAKDLIPQLRAAPLFGSNLVPDDTVTQATKRHNQAARGNILLASVEPQRKKYRPYENKRRPSFSVPRRPFRKETPQERREDGGGPSGSQQQQQAPRSAFRSERQRTFHEDGPLAQRTA